MGVFTQILTPTRYLFVKSVGRDKVFLDFVFPIGATALLAVAVFHVPELLQLDKSSGLISRIGGLLQILVGFYVAALAGVATFPTPALDQNAKGISFKNKPMRRREFLSSIFGYLAFLSIILFVSGIFWQVASCVVAQIPWPEVRFSLHVLAVVGYLFIFWQLIFITLFGLHYLVDRIHRPDPT